MTPKPARAAGGPLVIAAARVQVDPWWDQHWVGAQNATSNIVRSAFRHIQQAHPYWNRSNGADHFLVYSYDRGTALLSNGCCCLALTLEPGLGCFYFQAPMTITGIISMCSCCIGAVTSLHKWQQSIPGIWCLPGQHGLLRLGGRRSMYATMAGRAPGAQWLSPRWGAGRCDMAAALTLPEMGKSFAVMSYGDLAAR